MKMIIRYNDKELEIDADNVSITLPPQPETKTIGLIVQVTPENTTIKSHFNTTVAQTNYKNEIGKIVAAGTIDPEDAKILK